MGDTDRTAGHRYGTVTINDHAAAILGDYVDKVQVYLVDLSSPATTRTLCPDVQAQGIRGIVERALQSATSTQDDGAHQRLGLAKWSDRRNTSGSNDETLEVVSASNSSRSRRAIIQRRRVEATAVCTSFLALMLLNNVQPEMVHQVITNIQQDPRTGYIVVPFILWLTNFLTRSALTSRITDAAGDTLVFEDAYQDRLNIPLAYFDSEDILQGFLNKHYRGSSVAKLIEAQSYFFMLGNRYEDPVNLKSLCSGKLVDGIVVVMSVRYRTATPDCIQCTNRLELKCPQSYSCSFCRRSYRVRLLRKKNLRPVGSSDKAFFDEPVDSFELAMRDTSLGCLKNIVLDVLLNANVGWSEWSGSPKDEEYYSTPRSNPDKYRSKYKAVKKTYKALQGELAETTDEAQHSYLAAKREEAIKLQTLAELKGQLRALMLESQVLEDRVADKERKGCKQNKGSDRKGFRVKIPEHYTTNEYATLL